MMTQWLIWGQEKCKTSNITIKIHSTINLNKNVITKNYNYLDKKKIDNKI